MALRVVEQVGVTDVGRQRSANEDSLVIAPPFFAVADGMGGAKAGEVASAAAIEVFEGEAESTEGAESQLARIVREANRRIHALAVSDESFRGMGTTLTAAKITDDQVSLAHVGDSRAYLLRNGELEQLTRDHSLVAELERSGQITPEAAEHHPQRSIITRALGPEPDVEVDTYTIAGRDGDLFMICSDGLDDAAEALVRAANQSGGRDNITVVLFRLGESGEPDGAPGEDETIAGEVTAADVRAAADTPTAAPGSKAGPAVAERLGDAPADATIVASPKRSSAAAAASRTRRRRRLRLGTFVRGIVVLAVLTGVVVGLYALSRQVYFIGTNDAGLVTLYRGVPYELPFGLELYEEEYASGVPARAIPDRRRGRVLDHEWRGREDAVDLLRALERGQLSG